MKVYKFGGGVLKDAQAMEQLSKITETVSGNLLIVVSAFGKTTGALEAVLAEYYSTGKVDTSALNEIEESHLELLNQLSFSEEHSIFAFVKKCFANMNEQFRRGLSDRKYYEYDRIVSVGELLSANIVSACLEAKGFDVSFADARNLLVSDDGFGDAKILWEPTIKAVREAGLFSKNKLIVTQGFTAKTQTGELTTLGREGSDYTAAIFAYCLDADEVVFWKNVPGILNADPEIHPDARLLETLSYKEAVEQTFYGAKILHPKTIKPLENKKIPVKVRPFNDLSHCGTSISDIDPTDKTFYPKVPIYIEKNDQILISVASQDFSFIAEDSLSRIFALLDKYRLKVSVMQNSAISFSFCAGNVKERIPLFINELKQDYKVLYNDNLSLITIRHYTDKAVRERLKDKEVLLRQISRYTARFVVRNGLKPSVFRYDFVGQYRGNLDD